MLRQRLWADALRASGGKDQLATSQLIRTHLALVAFEAAAAMGRPEQVWLTDIDGYPLDPQHPWNREGQ